MAKKTYLVDIDLAKNELQNATIQNLTGDPAALKAGLIYYNTTDSVLRICDGAVWADVDSTSDLSKVITSDANIASDAVVLGSGTRKVSGHASVTGADLTTVKTHASSAHAPSDAEKNVQSDWNQATTGADDFIKNKPTIPSGPSTNTVLSSGMLTDEMIIKGAGGKNVEVTNISHSSLTTSIADTALNNTHRQTAHAPANAEQNVNADWSSSDGDSEILNKPTTISAGQATDISNNTTKLAGIADGAEVNVQSDWTQTTTTHDAYIKNKPTIPTVPANVVTGTGTSGKMTKFTGTGTVGNATNTDSEVSTAVTHSGTVTGNPHAVTYGQVGAASAGHNHDGDYLDLDGEDTMFGNIKMGSNKITELADGTLDTDAVNLKQLNDSVAGGVTYKGGYDAASNNPKLVGVGSIGITHGDMYSVTVEGTISCGAPTGDIHFKVGDSLIAKSDVPSATTAVCADWVFIETEIQDADEGKKGIIAIATQATVDQGTNDTEAITPKKNRQYNYTKKISKTVSGAITAGTSPKTVTFAGLDTSNGVNVQVRDSFGDEYQFRITTSGSSVTFASNDTIPSDLTAYVTAATTNV